MSDKAQRKIHIQWVRSGIGFSYRAKDAIRSLGLRRLRQVVERPDTPQVRGLVAKIPHLVEIVKEVSVSIWGSTPEYTISAPEAKPQPEQVQAEVAKAKKVSAAAEVPEPVAHAARRAKQDKREKERAAASRVGASKKQAKLAAKEKARAADRAAESKKKERPAAEKRAKPSGKGKK
jgi:large subunit ribosomal protein L30